MVNDTNKNTKYMHNPYSEPNSCNQNDDVAIHTHGVTSDRQKTKKTGF